MSPALIPEAPPGIAPALALTTDHAPGAGIHAPSAWWPHVAGFHRSAGGEEVQARLLLADTSLAGLPAAIAAWGRDRVAVGVSVIIPDPGASNPHAILVAPTRAAYARLCRFLSWQSEQPDDLTTWLGQGIHEGRDDLAPDLTGIVALVRDLDLGATLRRAGAEVRWRCQDHPDDHGPFPGLWLPLVAQVSHEERVHDPIRKTLARRAQRPVLPDGLALEDIPHLLPNFEHRLDLLLAGHDLLASCGDGVPTGELHLPPSLSEDADGELRAKAWEGCKRRYGDPVPDEVALRLEHELEVIRDKGFSGYILTVADLAAGRRTCGRGSGASSLVVYCLGITQVDPVRYRLLFERFLSPSRTDPPDLDVDFPWDERDAVFVAALERYGRAHVAMVSTHQRIRPKGALRAVARAWGIPDADTSAVGGQLRAQRRYGAAANLAAPWPGLIEDAAAVEGLHLYYGLHCGGLVITPDPIRDLVPVHPAAKTIDTRMMPWEDETWEPVPAIAWEKDGAEQMGLVKIDILGNRSLAVIRDCLADLGALGLGFDESKWLPENDRATQEIVASGRTMGCFYIESPAMRQLLAKAASGDLDRLVVASSIIRPAASRWIDEYLYRLHHWRRTGNHLDHWYPHPSLRGLLSESFGILSYQEDVMLVAQEVAGFTERQANQLRKALGHWDTQERLMKFGTEFRHGARQRGIRADIVEEIWSMICSFSGYSFAKAHSASFALVSFQCAWLKAYHPAVFMARVIANEGGFYQPGAYIEEARRWGAEIRGPCVLTSAWRTAPEGVNAIRIGLHLVPLVSPRMADAIIRERNAGPFGGLVDFHRRTGVPGRTLLSLAACGALGALRSDLHDQQILWLAQTVALEAAMTKDRRKGVDPRGTTWLIPIPERQDPAVPRLRRVEDRATAFRRYQALGISADRHPLDFTEAEATTLARDLAGVPHGALVTVVGTVVTRRQVSARNPDGKAVMSFVTLEDRTGLIESVWFPEAYRAYGHLLDRGVPLQVQGMVDLHFGQASFVAQTAAALSLIY